MRLTRASRRGLRQRRQRAVADHGDAHAAGVEALGVRADDRSVDASAAALVDAAVGVDQEVVANVVPAVRAHVVGVDRADDRGHVAGRVAVRRVGVMHEDHAHRVGVARGRPAHRLVRAPPGPRDDGRLTRRRRQRPHGAQRAASGRHERDVHPPGSAHPHLEQPAAREPDRLGMADRPAAVGLQPGPARPGARARARAHLDLGAGAGGPASAQQIEREWGSLHRQDVQAGGAGRAQRELAVARVRRRSDRSGSGRRCEQQERRQPEQRALECASHESGFAGGARVPPAAPGGCRLRSPMRTLCLLAVALIAGLALTPGAAAATPHVRVVVLDADVDPVTADWIVDEIHASNDAHDSALVLQMDTPGGLLESMRKITQAELRSRVPIVAFVAPSGARAASAGFFLLQAGDIAAMVPGLQHGRRHADRHGRRQRGQRPALQADPRRRGSDSLPRERERPQCECRRAGRGAQEQRLPAAVPAAGPPPRPSRRT